MTKKLYKSRKDIKVDGVCAGAADYLKIDVTLVRLVTILAILFSGGTAIIAYIACAVIMPREPDTIDLRDEYEDRSN